MHAPPRGLEDYVHCACGSCDTPGNARTGEQKWAGNVALSMSSALPHVRKPPRSRRLYRDGLGAGAERVRRTFHHGCAGWQHEEKQRKRKRERKKDKRGAPSYRPCISKLLSPGSARHCWYVDARNMFVLVQHD